MIQGVLQLLNLLGLVGYGRTTTSATKFYLGLVLIGGYAVAAMVGGYTGLKDGNTQEGCKKMFLCQSCTDRNYDCHDYFKCCI